jgi:hypothetical protein
MHGMQNRHAHDKTGNNVYEQAFVMFFLESRLPVSLGGEHTGERVGTVT